LTKWFEVEESREEYIKNSAGWPLWAAFSDGKPVGFLCMKETGTDTVELAVMGVLEEYHRCGYGRKLFETAKEYAMNQGYSFFQVKTVKYGVYEDYDRTNDFYKSVGFKELEVLPEYWEEANPCQIYVMNLKSAINTIKARHSYRGAYSCIS
jgi:ribosomal protein S18 acetylase RimI-like enzyme